MSRSCFSSRLTIDTILTQEIHLWYEFLYGDSVLVHYFGPKENSGTIGPAFAHAMGVWVEIECGMEHIGNHTEEWGEEDDFDLAIYSVKLIDPPEGVFYSHSRYYSKANLDLLDGQMHLDNLWNK